MAKIGSKTKQRNANRVRLGLLLALFATAALGPGYGAHGQGEAPGELHLAMAVVPEGGGSISGHAGGDFSGHPGAGAGGHHHLPGAGAGPHDDADGVVPNGENGLVLLANYVPQGGLPGAGEGPTGGDSFQTAENTSGGQGFGSGGGGGGSGGGSGGGGGGFTGHDPGDGTGGVDPKPRTIPNETQTHGDGDPCALTNSCGDPPLTIDPKTDDRDIVPGGGSDLHVGAVPEPATWLMLIVGFMGVGSALRVRRRKAALA